MHFYILSVLAILFQGGTALDIDSEFITFTKLCFLPKPTVVFNFSSFISEDNKNLDPLQFVIGNKIMQEKIFHLLTEKAEKVSSEDLDKMCAKANVESSDEHGLSFGKVWDLENNTFTYTCHSSKDVVGIELCNVTGASQKFSNSFITSEDTLTFYHIANENVTMEINCFKSGQVGWALYSQNPGEITEEQKKSYFDSANALGFPENTNVVMYNEKCDL